MRGGPSLLMDCQTPLSRTVLNLTLVLSYALSVVLVTSTRTSSHAPHVDSTQLQNYTSTISTELWLSHTAKHIRETSNMKEDTSSAWAQTGVSMLPSLLSTVFRCQDSHETLTGKTGAIAFTADVDCVKRWVWNIHMPVPENGTLIQFHQVHLEIPCEAEFFLHKMLAVYSWTGYNSPGTARPLLLTDSRAKLVLTMPKESFRDVCAVLNVTYTAQSARNMPQEIVEPGSVDFYNCSGDVLIPFIFRCNMIRECAGNEDEDHCDYLDPGCGDWIPLRQHCLKLEFVVKSNEFPFGQVPTSPIAAKQTCLTRHGAQLAQLRDMDDVNFVGRIMHQAGFRSAVIAVKKLKPVSKRLNHLYRFLWQWGNQGSPIVYSGVEGSYRNIGCAVINVRNPGVHTLAEMQCESPSFNPEGYVCMKQSSSYSQVTLNTPLSVHLPKPSHQVSQFQTRQCLDGSLMQRFHRCYHETRQETTAGSSHSFPMFACQYGPPVHYTLVCDGNADCPGADDETDCGPVKFPPLSNSMFTCQQFQLIPKLKLCNGKPDCFDGSDEQYCETCAEDNHVLCEQKGCFPKYYQIALDWHMCIFYGWYTDPELDLHNCSCVVSMDGFGAAYLQPANNTNMEGMFACRDGDYSIPSFLFNNGELDCKYGEDENIPLTNLTCPGFYRCQDSFSCVHPNHVCDGIHHCPYKDDERYCDLVCPEGCLCEGHAFFCVQFSNFTALLQARSLDLSGSVNPSLHGIHFLELLQLLNLSHCGIKTVTLKDIAQLRILDVSYNELKNMSSDLVNGLFRLRYLDVSHNPFLKVVDSVFEMFIRQSGLSNLQRLILRHTKLHSIKDKVLGHLTQLEVLDIRDNSLDSYDRHVFWGLNSLYQLYTDDFKLCCPYFHGFHILDCVAPSDELSSCSDLLRLNIFRVFLWLIALLAIVGNVAVGLYRLSGAEQHTFSAFHVLVSSLCSADFIMGVFLMMIGIADAQFQGLYVAKENAWKRSIVCNTSGFLGFMSSEASALTIYLITLDRMLVLCFPLKSHLHMGARSALAACGVVWFVAVTLATLPLLAELEFYGVTGICLPLPITNRQFSGQFFSFGVFIIFNFVIFFMIGLGQIFIYRAILKASKAAGTNRKSQEMTIARRLFLVIVSDFCCWFPIGLMGILVASGISISGEVNVWAAIFILPFNSALNPFLYTLNSYLEKRAAKKVKKETDEILTNIQSYLPKMLPNTQEELLRICVMSNMVRRERILQILQSYQDDHRE